MTRSNKKTRIKGLPPKLQLQQKDARTGSYSSQVRIASDNRTGNYPVNWNDRNTIVFQESVTKSDPFISTVIQTEATASGFIAQWRFSRENLMSGAVGSKGSFAPLVRKLAVKRAIPSDESFILDYTGSNAALVEDVPFRGFPVPFNELSMRFSPSGSASAKFRPSTSGYDPFSIKKIGGNDGDSSGNQFSVGCWVKLEEPIATGYKGLISGRAWFTTSQAPEWLFWVDENHNIGGTVYFGGNPSTGMYATSSIQLNVGEWKYVNMFWKNTDIQFSTKNSGDTPVPDNFGTPGSVADKDNGETWFGGWGSEHVEAGVTYSNFPGLVNEPTWWLSAFSLGTGVAGGPLVDAYGRISIDPFVGVNMGGGFDLSTPQFFESSEEFTTLYPETAAVRKGVADAIAHFTPGQNLTPFRDNNNPAVDGKSVGSSFYATGSTVEEAGEGFTSPLWSKTKIEIPINVASEVTLPTYVSASHNNSPPWTDASTGINYPMSYFNFLNKTWSGAGIGIAYSQITESNDLGQGNYENPYKDYNMLGFASSPVMISPESATGVWNNVISGVFEWQASAGAPFSNYGFPFHPKFHATASNTLKMSDYINRPFLLEKIFIELSASFVWEVNSFTTSSFKGFSGNTITSLTESLVPACINNIFLMNQRHNTSFTNIQRVESLSFDPNNPLNDSLINVSVPTNHNVSNINDKIYVDTIRELIGYGGISSFAANMPPTQSFRGGTTALFTSIPPETNNPTALLTREVNFFSEQEVHDDLQPLSWTGLVQIEIQARSPIEIDRANANADNVFSIHAETYNTSVPTYADLKYSFGGRNGLGVIEPSGKDRRSPIAALQPTSEFDNLFSAGKENVLVPYQQHTIPNGYLLEPSDELILGWQQPLPMFIYPSGTIHSSEPNNKNIVDDTQITSITFLPHPESKIILYGSEIREDKEFHDTLNQLLTSVAIHEVIE